MSWPRIKLADVCEIRSGKRLPKGHELTKIKTNHIYIRGNDIRDGKVRSENNWYINNETFSRISRYIVNTNDICLTIVGNIGDVGIVPQNLNGANLTENAVKLIHLKNTIPQFLKYALLAPNIQTQMKNFAAGAAQPKLGLYKVKEISIPLPSLPNQQKISSILSAYDDLIENNTRCIKILEEMAQTIYKEWFVNFRFPGYEKVRFVDSSLGKIPEGWEPVKFSDAIFINPLMRIQKEIEKPYVSMADLSASSMLISTTEYRTGNNGSKFQNGDTLFARITPCLENGKTGFVQFLSLSIPYGIGSTEFIVMRSKTLTPEFVYMLARNEDVRQNAISSMTGASGRQRVQNECFDKFMFSQPDSDSLSKFTNIVAPIFNEIHLLSNKNQNLRKTRDLLLPKLMSGEVEV